MNELLNGYTLALGVVFLAWLGLSLFVVVTRTLYDVRAGFVRTALRLIERRFEADEDRQELGWVLRKLPQRTIERVAADTTTSLRLAQVFAAHAVATNGERLVEAAASTGELAKWRRISALRILARAGTDDVLPLLETALADPDEDVSATAVVTLGGMRDERAAAVLVQALGQGGSRIATQLDDFPLPLAHLLLPLLRHWDPTPRYWAVKLLARYADAPELPLELATLAGDPDPGVRAAVAETLGTIGGPAALSVGMQLLDDPVPYVRAHAARTLGAQDRSDLAPRIATLLADEDWWVRTGAKQALAALGPDATDHVLPLLESEDEFARNGAAEVLQDTGAVDRLVRELAANPSDATTRRTLRLVAEAGGTQYGEAMIARAGGLGEERLRELLEDEAAAAAVGG